MLGDPLHEEHLADAVLGRFETPALLSTPSLALITIDENYFEPPLPKKSGSDFWGMDSMSQMTEMSQALLCAADVVVKVEPSAVGSPPSPLAIPEPLMQVEAYQTSSEASPDEATPENSPRRRPLTKRKRSLSSEKFSAELKEEEEAPASAADDDDSQSDPEAMPEVLLLQADSHAEPLFQWEACAGCRSVKQVCKVESVTDTVNLRRSKSLGLQLAHIPFSQFGLVISEHPQASSSAAAAALEMGDVILSIDGITLNAVDEANTILSKIGQEATLLVERPHTCVRCAKMGRKCDRAHGLKKSFTSCACCTDPKVKKRCIFSQSNLNCDRCLELDTVCSKSLGDTSKKNKRTTKGRRAAAGKKRVPAPIQMGLRI